MLQTNDEFLFTRQHHLAQKIGEHWDYRLVHDDVAYSFATKKPLPEPGKMIVLFEQPVHTRHYALSKKVVIPTGQYGAGTTYLDMVRKAKVTKGSLPEGKIIISTAKGEKFLLKKAPEGGKYGEKAWLMRNLSGLTEKWVTGLKGNRYLEKIAGMFSEDLDFK